MRLPAAEAPVAEAPVEHVATKVATKVSVAQQIQIEENRIGALHTSIALAQERRKQRSTKPTRAIPTKATFAPHAPTTNAPVVGHCTPGHFFADERSQCMPCPSGTFQPSSGRHTCVVCRDGTYQDQPGQVFCIATKSAQMLKQQDTQVQAAEKIAVTGLRAP
jgi:hypothetical protein